MVISILCLQLRGASPTDPHQGSAPGPCWGTSVSGPRFVPLRNKFLATPLLSPDRTAASRSACYAHEGIRAGRRASCHGAKRRGSLLVIYEIISHHYDLYTMR